MLYCRSMEPPAPSANRGFYFLALPFLYLAWRFLNQWYLFQETRAYLAFAACALVAVGTVLLAFRSGVAKTLRALPAKNLLLVASLAILILPWPEWLRLQTPKGDWSRQILSHCIWLYAIAAFLLTVPAVPEFTGRALHALFHRLPGQRALLILPPVLYFLLAAALVLFVNERNPMEPDTIAQLFQAKNFSLGRLAAPAPPYPEFFNADGDMLAIRSGKWFGVFPPGFSLLLTLPLLLGLEWFLPPLLGSLTVLLLTLHVRRSYPAPVAWTFAILMIFSPFLLLQFSNIMVHSAELCLIAAILYLSQRATGEETPSPWLLLPLVAIAVPVRYFSILAFLAPALACCVVDSLRRKDRRPLIAIAFGLIVGGAGLAWYQWQLTGDPFFPTQKIELADQNLGFGTSLSRPHSFLGGVENTSAHLLAMDNWLNGWYTGSLFFVGAFLLRFRWKRSDSMLLAGSGLLLLLYFLFPRQDLFSGPRFFAPIAPVLILFIARLVSDQELQGRLLPTLIVASFLACLPLRMPLLLQRLNSAQMQGVRAELNTLGGRRAIVFLDGTSQMLLGLNDPSLQGPLLLCRNLGGENEKIIRAFPGRESFYLRFAFGEQLSAEGKYRLMTTPAPSFTFSAFGLILKSASFSRDLDLYDLSYRNPLVTMAPRERLVAMSLSTAEDENRRLTPNQHHYRAALRLLVKLILVPYLSWQENPQSWSTRVNLRDYAVWLTDARVELAGSKELGRQLLPVMEKVEKRIDKDRNGSLSGVEIRRFLDQKLTALRSW